MGVIYGKRDPFSGGTIRGVVAENGLIMHLDAGNTNSYPGTGTTWFDLSDTNSNGTLVNGPTFNNNNGGYISFDGNNDYVGITDNLGNPSQFTVEFWLYPTDIASHYSQIFNAPSSGSRCIILETAGQISFRIPGGNGVYAGGPGTGTRFLVNTWGHCACTYDQSNRRIYNNTELRLTYSEPGVSVNFGSPRIFTGSSTYGYQGRMPIFRIYNRALSETEIRDNFLAQKSRFGL